MGIPDKSYLRTLGKAGIYYSALAFMGNGSRWRSHQFVPLPKPRVKRFARQYRCTIAT